MKGPKEDNLGYLLNSTTNALNTLMQRMITEHEIDVPFEQLKLLLFISFNEGINQQQISNELNKTKAGISRLVDGLVKKGLVSTKEDDIDRRVKRLYTTASGKKTKDNFYPIGRKNLDVLENELGESDSAELKAHLISLKEIILKKLNRQ